MIKIKKLAAFSLLSSITLLTGCIGTGSHFDCNTVGGIQGCASLSDVKKMADQGDFNQDDKSNHSSSALISDNSKPTGYFLKTPGADTPGSGSPLRYGETLQNVWIAPYTTKDGSYMWASMTSIIVEPGHWIGEPPTAISQSGAV